MRLIVPRLLAVVPSRFRPASGRSRRYGALVSRNGLAHAAVLKAHPNIADYPAATEQDANKDRQPYHLLVAEDCDNVAIVGDGTIDSDGFAFWNPPMRDLVAQGVDPDAYVDEHGLPDVYRKPNHPWWRENKQRVTVA